MAKNKYTIRVFAAILLAGLSSSAHSLSIYVINTGVSGHSMVQSAVNGLNNLGHTVSAGNTLADYSAYAQVWDLRYDATLGAADTTAMGSYLAGGGRMYLTGEHTGFNASRNDSLTGWVFSIGGGSMVLNNVNHNGTQNFTAAAQAVGLHNSPNALVGVNTLAANTVGAASITQGFLATFDPQATTQGSVVGWDFGDITGAQAARMLIGFDIELFGNGQDWTENMVTYLGAPSNAVPEPSMLALMGICVAGLAFTRRRMKGVARTA